MMVHNTTVSGWATKKYLSFALGTVFFSLLLGLAVLEFVLDIQSKRIANSDDMDPGQSIS